MTSTSPPTPARRDRAARVGLGRRRLDCRASGSGRSAAARAGARFEITTHRAEAYQPDSRKPDVVFGDSIEVDLSRRDFTVNAMALQASRRSSSIDPFDGMADLAAQAPADPARPRGVVRRRPAADAARSAVRRTASSLVPDAALVEAVRAHARPAGDRLAPSGSATSSTSSWSSDEPPPGCGSSSRRGWPTSSCPSSRRSRSNRTRSTATRTCSRTPSRSSTRPARRPPAAAGRAVPRRRQAEDAGLRARGGDASTTTRSSAPAWPRDRMTRPALLERRT